MHSLEFEEQRTWLLILYEILKVGQWHTVWKQSREKSCIENGTIILSNIAVVSSKPDVAITDMNLILPVLGTL